LALPAALVLALLIAAAAPASPPGPAGEAARLTPAQAEALVREVSAAVEQLRGLKFKTPVKVEIIDGATARARFKAKIEPAEEREARDTQAAYVQLGLVPRGTDLISDFLKLTETDVLGYYEHGSKTFVLLSHVSADEVQGVMAHELTHALEDQHYDLGAVSKQASGDGDRATAITAVIEGSAMGVMIAYFNRNGGEKKAREEVAKVESRRVKRLKAAPSFTQRTLTLPYVLGFTFLLRGKPWEWHYDGMRLADIRQAYANPPRSTRQILHPEQYWGGREPPPPMALVFPDLSSVLGAGWSKAASGSIGELGLAVLTGAKLDLDSPEALLPERWTNKAASGVLGDLYHHYVNGDLRVTVLVARFETSDDALEFDQALLNRGKQMFRLGPNALVVAGEVGDKGEALAIAALQGMQYWPAH
jgi:hypothetical protein